MLLRSFTLRACRNGALLAAATAAAVAAAPAAGGAPRDGQRPLAVSVPAEATTLVPGATDAIPIRIVNPGSAPVSVRITSSEVHFGNDGRVKIAGRDPVWEERVDYPNEPVTVPAQGYRELRLTVRMPTHISPDLYFVGFLVTPVADTVANLTYVNQIGSYVTIDVPGPRVRALAADLSLPGFAFTSRAVRGELHVENTGRTAAAYWIESDTTATPGSSRPRQGRVDRSLVPTGRSRTVVVDAKPSFPIAVVTMHVHVFYPGRSDAATAEIVLTKRVLVVQPLAMIILVGLVITGLLVYVRRRRKRRGPPARRTSRARHRPASRSSRKRGSRSEPRVPAHANRVSRLDRALARARGEAPPGATRA